MLFYTPDLAGSRHTLPEEESRHAVRVLRLVEGDAVQLTDGRGNLHTARIVSASPKRCEVEIVSTQADYGRRPYTLTLAVAPTKNSDRFEWFLEKATEIGVDRIVPLECERSERRAYKTDRGNKVIESAMKQSLQAFHPRLDELTRLADVLKTPFAGDRFIAHCAAAAEKRSLRESVKKGGGTLILIGPEGDFSPQEIDAARRAGFGEVSLGASRLRTETAALAACHTVALINE
jgi:16S rRNA (uracil1498-N3)-methyltransferase